ncbi:hypothetical protein JQS43_16095 [Natronosporangium hydrolyticum]|uniref:MarR family transcriptional regulator n=1 Tax=Natronosporangium hydrolyticum TaxID=2811111 RepID=A0A895YA26_9ACTN|nr:hypothetical protein [Natronosporangium hydrolyticum]QSB13155.1 hypothetical protein JQS43_16095 [Natronosporangium hydrolyticum]
MAAAQHVDRGPAQPHRPGAGTRPVLDRRWAQPAAGLGEFAARGWVEEPNSTVTLTETGLAAHAALAPRVDQTRAVVLGGLTLDQYQETVRILSVMAGNVEAALASRTTETAGDPFGGGR